MRLTAFASLLCLGSAATFGSTVQLDCTSVFNARPVSIVDHGALVPWSGGIDGGGKADGFATACAARAHHDPAVHALPDDGKFPATHDHPFVQLAYGIVGPSQSQARALIGESTFDVLTPKQRLGELILFFSSAEGASQLSVVLHYVDGTQESRAIEMPDYYQVPKANDPQLFALASDLAKWNASGNLAEADHHSIDGWKISVNRRRILKSITVHKGAAGYAVFWGATGVTAK